MSVPPSSEQTAVIEFDLACTKCGYNLRTLDARSSCPECGQRVLDSVEAQLRRRISRFDLTRFREWPDRSLRSVSRGAAYAIAANAIVLVLIHLPDWMSRRRTPMRTVLLVAVCVALALAAMSVWRFAVRKRADRDLGLGQWLLRLGAVGAVLWPLAVAIRNDGEGTFQWTGLHLLFTAGMPIPLLLIAWATAIGAFGRLAYAHWWLRLEGLGLLAWPLLLAALPVGFFFVFFAPGRIGQYYRGNFVSLDFFSEVPLASGCWPLLIEEFTSVIRSRTRFSSRLLDPDLLVAVAALLLQALVLICDLVIATLATRELRMRRSRDIGSTAASSLG